MKTWHFDEYAVTVPDSHYDLYDDNIEVVVTLKSGERYKTTVYTDKYEENSGEDSDAATKTATIYINQWCKS